MGVIGPNGVGKTTLFKTIVGLEPLDGGELEIGFNSRYLLDALRVIPSEEVTLELQNGLSPIVFTPCDKKYDFAYMVLPVRLRSNS